MTARLFARKSSLAFPCPALVLGACEFDIGDGGARPIGGGTLTAIVSMTVAPPASCVGAVSVAEAALVFASAATCGCAALPIALGLKTEKFVCDENAAGGLYGDGAGVGCACFCGVAICAAWFWAG